MITDLTLLEQNEPFVLPKGKVALLFYIPGYCAGCKRVISILETKKLEDWTILKVDSEDENMSWLIKKYNVCMAPTIITFENGEQKDTIAGLKAFIEKKDIFGD
jgi:thiol-disulfide isomerase/thioredoxin